MIDGCSRLQSLVQIILPVMATGIASTFLFAFVQCWNEIFLAIMFIDSESLKTIPVAINSLIIPKGKYVYGRVENPTTRLLEQKLAALEKADGALCFASGMAAITASMLHCLKPGDHLVTITNVYGPARTFCETYLTELGVETTFISGIDTSEFERAIRPNTTMFYLESPSTAVMELQDLKAIAVIAKKHGIKTAVDNTWATPVYQQPLSLGIDMSIHTMSKYIGGHSDIIGGVLCANKEIISKIKSNERELIGGIIGPFEAWLALRGLRTMPARLARSSKNAQAVAELLEKHPHVRRVNYPGVSSYAQFELAKKQMSGNCGREIARHFAFLSEILRNT